MINIFFTLKNILQWFIFIVNSLLYLESNGCTLAAQHIARPCLYCLETSSWRFSAFWLFNY